MHINLPEVHARFQQDWERRTKSRHSASQPAGPDVGPSAPAPVLESASSSSEDVRVFERVSRPPGPPRDPGPSTVPGPSDAAATPPPPPSSVSSSDLSLILRTLRQLGRRFDYFENQCHARFDFLDQEIASLRRQAYHPPSPPPSHASYRPYHDRASAGDTFDPVLQHVQSSSSPVLETEAFRQPDYRSSQHYPPEPDLAPHPPTPAAFPVFAAAPMQPAVGPPVAAPPTPVDAPPVDPSHVAPPAVVAPSAAPAPDVPAPDASTSVPAAPASEAPAPAAPPSAIPEDPAPAIVASAPPAAPQLSGEPSPVAHTSPP